MAALRVHNPLLTSSSSPFLKSQLQRNRSFNIHTNGSFNNLVSVAHPNGGIPGSISKTASFAQLIESLIDRNNLMEAEAEEFLNFLLQDANESLISAFLVFLRAKGENYEEVVGLARAMFKHYKKVEGLDDAVDIVGTGGDGANTVI